MRKQSCLTMLFFVVCISASAQQEPYYTHFAFNRVLYNPAYAGATNGICMNLINHKQWLMLPEQTGLYRTESGLAPIHPIPGAIGPVTKGVAISAPIGVYDNRNLGGFYAAAISDVVAYENNTYLKLGFSGSVPLRNGAEIRAGIDFTNQTKRWNTAALRAMDIGDPLLPVAGNPADSKWLIGAGLYARIPTFYNLQTGISLSSINKVSFGYFNQGGNTTYIESARHLYAFASCRIPNFLHRPDLSLDPNLLIKTVNGGNGWVKPQIDVQALMVYQRKFAAGIGGRVQTNGADASYVMLGFYPIQAMKIKNPGRHNLRIGMSYDFTMQSLRLSSRNTYEIQVNYCFQLSRIINEIVIDHPRIIGQHRGYGEFTNYDF